MLINFVGLIGKVGNCVVICNVFDVGVMCVRYIVVVCFNFDVCCVDDVEFVVFVCDVMLMLVYVVCVYGKVIEIYGDVVFYYVDVCIGILFDV